MLFGDLIILLINRFRELLPAMNKWLERCLKFQTSEGGCYTFDCRY